MSHILNFLKYVPGFHTKRKIIVLESDDWGSIRMPSKDIFNQLEKNGLKMRVGMTSRYNLYDTLATGKDIADLFEVITSVKDSNGNHCVITPICLVANPDFDRIKENGYSDYYFEPFTETLKRYPGCESSFELWKEGMKQNIFRPQFHGREHLNVIRWMKLLRNAEKDALLAFSCRMWSYPPRLHDYDPNKSLQAAFYFDEIEELEYLRSVIIAGLDLFNSIFGYRASYFVPANGPLSSKLEETLSNHGIRYIQTARMIYKEPIGSGKTRTQLRYNGLKNRFGQIYMTRNCFFEPSEKTSFDWKDKCLKEIETTFRYKTPAIISSHRVNYTGALDIKNHENGLRQLKQLLIQIKKQWPDVEFMSSEKLGALIN